MATAEFSKFAGILSAALSQHHLSVFEIAIFRLGSKYCFPVTYDLMWLKTNFGMLVRGVLRYLKEKYLIRVIWYVILIVIICNSGYCNQTLLYTVIQCLTMPFESFFIYIYFCTLLLVQKLLHHQEDT